MSIALYVISWILIFIIVVSVSLVVLFGRNIDQCRTAKTLYCYADETTGWRCNSSDVSGFVTLSEQLKKVDDECNPIHCPTSDDTPATATTPEVIVQTILPFDPGVTCDTAPAGACDASNPDIVGIVANGYTIPIGGLITGDSIFDWYCNPSNPVVPAATTALQTFLGEHPDLYACKPVAFVSS